MASENVFKLMNRIWLTLKMKEKVELERMNKEGSNCYYNGKLGKIFKKVFAEKKFGIVMMYLTVARSMVQKLDSSLNFLMLKVSATRTKSKRFKK